MYVCMYVCMYVYMYIYVHTCALFVRGEREHTIKARRLWQRWFKILYTLHTHTRTTHTHTHTHVHISIYNVLAYIHLHIRTCSLFVRGEREHTIKGRRLWQNLIKISAFSNEIDSNQSRLREKVCVRVCV